MEQIYEVSSLTDPNDLVKNGSGPFIPDSSPPLSKEETVLAISELSIGSKMVKPTEESSMLAKKFGFGKAPLFTKADRHFVDPALSNQDIALFSFVPCADAKPNKYGVYGFAKIRGTFANIEQSDQRAAELIQKHDSIHKIYHVKVGTPFPVVLPKVSQTFAASVKDVNVKGDAKNEISRFVKDVGEEDKKVMEELKDRERQLREDVAKSPEQKAAELTPLDSYIYARKRMSDNLFVFEEHRKKLHDVKAVILQAQAEANALEESNPDVLNEYKDKYDKASKESGIDTSTDNMALMIRKNFYEKPDLDTIFSTNLI
jgi:gas vesicle protein